MRFNKSCLSLESSYFNDFPWIAASRSLLNLISSIKHNICEGYSFNFKSLLPLPSYCLNKAYNVLNIDFYKLVSQSSTCYVNWTFWFKTTLSFSEENNSIICELSPLKPTVWIAANNFFKCNWITAGFWVCAKI